MRKFIFIGFTAAGMAVGFLSTLEDGWGLRLLMSCLGAFVGAVAGGSISGYGRGGSSMFRRDEILRGLGTSSDDLTDNYWRDEGQPQFMKPPSPDNKQFGGSGGMAD